MNKSTKIGWMAGIFAIGLAATSCSNNAIKDAPDNGDKAVTTLTVHITDGIESGGLKDANGTDEGSTQEKSVDHWGVFASDENGLYKYYPAETNNTPDDVSDDALTIKKVLVNSEAYALVNGSTELIDQSKSYQKDVIAHILQKLTKKELGEFTTALQQNHTDPNFSNISFSGKGIPMIGHGTVVKNNADEQHNSTLLININRMFAKINLTVSKTKGGDMGDATITSVDAVAIVGVRPAVSLDGLSTFDADIIKDIKPNLAQGKTFFDDFDNNALNELTSNEFRYVYDFQTPWSEGATDGEAYMYTTANNAPDITKATAIVVKATINAKWDGVTPSDRVRYYRAYVADKPNSDPSADWTSYVTEPNGIYNINATINSQGHIDPDDQVTDLDVTVKIQPWNVFDVNTDFK